MLGSESASSLAPPLPNIALLESPVRPAPAHPLASSGTAAAAAVADPLDPDPEFTSFKKVLLVCILVSL